MCMKHMFPQKLSCISFKQCLWIPKHGGRGGFYKIRTYNKDNWFSSDVMPELKEPGTSHLRPPDLCFQLPAFSLVLAGCSAAGVTVRAARGHWVYTLGKMQFHACCIHYLIAHHKHGHMESLVTEGYNSVSTEAADRREYKWHSWVPWYNFCSTLQIGDALVDLN